MDRITVHSEHLMQAVIDVSVGFDIMIGYAVMQGSRVV